MNCLTCDDCGWACERHTNSTMGTATRLRVPRSRRAKPDPE